MDALEDFGKLTLRVALGVLILFHGLHKVLDGIEPLKPMLAAYNLPDALAYGVYLGEIVGPVLVILGVFSRVGALLIAFNMIAAVLLAGMGAILTLAPTGGYALELEALYFFSAVTVFLLGAGKYAIGDAGRWN